MQVVPVTALIWSRGFHPQPSCLERSTCEEKSASRAVATTTSATVLAPTQPFLRSSDISNCATPSYISQLCSNCIDHNVFAKEDKVFASERDAGGLIKAGLSDCIVQVSVVAWFLAIGIVRAQLALAYFPTLKPQIKSTSLGLVLATAQGLFVFCIICQTTGQALQHNKHHSPASIRAL